MGIFNFKNSKTADKNAEKLYASSRSFQKAGTSHKDGRYVSTDELSDYIAGFLSPSLEIHGFKYLKSKRVFRRTGETGCEEILIWFVDHLHYHVNFIFDKRIDSLQKIITKVKFENGFNSGCNYKEHATLSVTYGNITGRAGIEIVSYSVLERELPNVLKFIENEILPCFDKLNSIDFVHQTLNYPEKDKKNPFSFFARKGSYEDSMITGLIIAKTVNDLNYDNLFKAYMASVPKDSIIREQLTKLNEYFNNKTIQAVL